MADIDPSRALPAEAHPMAKPGYGKRQAPNELPRTASDFAHLPPREASIAALIDQLPEGAAIDGKSLAEVHPLYGQAACLTALRRLSEAGHLRRFQEHLVTEGAARWVTRTYFTRTPRDDAWWAHFQAGRREGEPSGDDAAPPAPEAEPPRPASRPVGRPARSDAHQALATLGSADPRLTLSAAECATLELLAAQWLERGLSVVQLTSVLTAGLPLEIHSAGGLVRRRLRDKMPPEPVAPALAPRPPLRLVECTVCRAPGRPEVLTGGLCGPCRGQEPAPITTEALDVQARAAAVRRAMRPGPANAPAAQRRARSSG